MLAGSLLNLEAVAAAAAGGGDVEVVCAGLEGRFTIEDAYCAGRIAELLGYPGRAALVHRDDMAL